MQRVWTIFGAALIAIACLVTHESISAPLDVTNTTPRRIEVRFEISPPDEPGSLDRRWSDVRVAYLEPEPDTQALRIRIPAEVIEAQLRSAGTDAIPGTFSEFVWRLDPDSGHVLAAQLTGKVREHLRFGLIRSSAQVDIRVEMTTDGSAGFDPDHGILGVRTNRFCAPMGAASGCVAVAPVRYDRQRGYVNAVGSLRAASRLAEIRAFSPLGEVKFSERISDGTERVVSGPTQPDALCSDEYDEACGANLGGES